MAVDPFAPGANQPPSSFDGTNPAIAILGDTNLATAIVDPVVGVPLTADITNLFDGDFFATSGRVINNLAAANVHYQWQVQDLARGVWLDINGATSVSYTPAQFFVGQALRVMVSYTDPTGFVEHIASLPTAVLATAPAANTAPFIVTQQGLVGLPDTSSAEDTTIDLFLPVTRAFGDQQTASNLLTFAATLANGAALSTMGLSFVLIPDAVNGGVLGARIIGTPPPNFTGAIDIRVTATDGGPGVPLAVTDTFRINVIPVNDPPVAGNDTYQAVKNTILNVGLANSVLVNDADVEGKPLTAVLSHGPAHGSLLLNADGTFSYKPFANFTGIDTFTYRASDGKLLGNIATVTLEVRPPTGAVDIDSVEINAPIDGVATLHAGGGNLSTTFVWQQLLPGGLWSDVGQGTSFTPNAGLVGALLRVQGTYTDVFGTHIEASAKYARVGDNGANSLASSSHIDFLAGLGGDDIYNVGAGDIVLEAVDGGNDTVRSAAIDLDLANYANVENVTLSGTLALNAFGNDGDNVLRGDLATGANILTGRGGNDTYFVDAGDSVDESAAAGGGGIDTVRASVSFTLGDGVENLTLTGTAVSGTGNALDNLIIGNALDNIIDGGAGIDTMRGGGGSDTYYVDAAGDVVTEANVAGTDLVLATASFTLSANVENLTLLGTDNIDGTGNTSANTLVGNDGNNVLNGRQGNDVMTGNGGADQFVFNTGLGTTNVDIITDFTAGLDKIVLDDAVFRNIGPLGTLANDAFNLGTTASDATDRVLYDTATGDLWYDRDGLNGTAAVKFAHVGAGLSLQASDFIII